jgi:pyruvate kinase
MTGTPSSARGRERGGRRRDLGADIDALIGSLDAYAEQRSTAVAEVDPVHRDDAVNLIHYLALRHHDVRGLQRCLAEHGLSSLGRSEPHVMATLEAIRAALAVPTGRQPRNHRFGAGRLALDANTDRLFGPRPARRVPRIMVTLPTEAATDQNLVQGFAQRGMDVARVNGAHDHPDDWEAMARNVADASEICGRPIPICFDLPGPKLRTGPIAEGPPVVRLRPVRDPRGVAIVPARVILAAGAEDTQDPVVPVDAEWLAACAPGDTIHLHDTRGSPRTFKVLSRHHDRLLAEVWDTTYVETGTVLHNRGRSTTVGWLPPVEQYLVLQPDDRLHVTGAMTPQPPWRPGMAGDPTIGCDLPAVFDAVHPGERVLLDDGKFISVVDTVDSREFTVRVSAAPADGGRLRADKGINFLDTDLPIPMLAEADAALLEVAAKHGDMIGLSFLRREHDIDTVIDRLDAMGADHLGLVCKIETVPGFQRLPEILLRAMRRPRVGVMIARGDLAVESSFERLAEVQEEILWLCEAAHTPVIWATGVLDQLARTGHPTRAEITDAAMAQRAECVMLNKGPHINLAIETLDDIMKRMASHQRKKTALLRPLHAWDHS